MIPICFFSLWIRFPVCILTLAEKPWSGVPGDHLHAEMLVAGAGVESWVLLTCFSPDCPKDHICTHTHKMCFGKLLCKTGSSAGNDTRF